MESSFAIVFAVIIVEIILSGTWNRFYFTFGVPIFFTRVPYAAPALDDRVISLLNSTFRSRVAPSLVFTRLGPSECAFREKFIQLKLFAYTPIMHGAIVHDMTRSEASVVGRLNWFPVVFAVVFATMTGSFLEMTAFVVGIFAIIYVIQAHRFRKVARFLGQYNGNGQGEGGA